MCLSIQNIIRVTKKTLFFSPITYYAIVFFVCLAPGLYFLKKFSLEPQSAFFAVFTILIKVVLLFSVTILSFSFFTSLVAFGYFKWKQHKSLLKLTINITAHDSTQQKFNVVLNPVIVPFLGFIRLRFFYDECFISEKFSPLEKRHSIFSHTYQGEFAWELPQIREYHLNSAIIYFEDFFQFFSFAAKVKSSAHFYVPSTNRNLNSTTALPLKTEETTTRIDELKRVEGELINYKHFENSDDVRRVVWKIYAKNKELVVRVPEIMDPYASHIYLYSSFYSQFDVKENAVSNQYFLNHYKNICWSVYNQLIKKGLTVKFINDQFLNANHADEKTDLVNYSISVSEWQRITAISDFVKPGNASVLIISSLNDPQDVEAFAHNCGNDVTIIYVPLSASLKQTSPIHLLRWLFVKNTSKLNSYQNKWKFLPLRLKITANEEKLAEIIKQTTNAVTI